MRYMGRMAIWLLAALVIAGLAGTSAAASLSNSGGGTWRKYQRDISIKENSGTALTDNQVLIELKGTDYPGEAQSSGADVRFTDSNGKELDYWIESWDYAGKSAKIWVKVQSIPASLNTIIRMYYGNPAATQLSNGDMTFDFFDDFSGDLSKWTEETGDWSVINRELKGTHLGCNNGPSDIIANYDIYPSAYGPFHIGKPSIQLVKSDININPNIWNSLELKLKGSNLEANLNDISITVKDNSFTSGSVGLRVWCRATNLFDNFRVRKYTSSEPTITLTPPKSSSLSVTKSASPYSIRQFQETAIKISIQNSGTTDIKAIEVMDSIHPSFDLTGGDFHNQKKYDIIRAGESREIQYTIKAKESGTFTLDPATVTYADSEGNIQEVKSEPVSIKVVPSSEGGVSGAPSVAPSGVSPTPTTAQQKPVPVSTAAPETSESSNSYIYEGIGGVFILLIAIAALRCRGSSQMEMPVKHEPIAPSEVKVSRANVKTAFGYKGATIIYKVKIENNTTEPLSDIKVYPYVPDVFLLKEKEKAITLIEPGSSQTVTFEIRPTGECGDCNVSGRVNYYDTASKRRQDIELEPKSLSIVCPMLHRKEISEDAWRELVSKLVKAEETTTDIPIEGEGLFGMISEILKDMNLFALVPNTTKTQQIFRGTAKFYGEGVKGLQYAAQIEVVGGAKKSKLILKTWAEKEEALTGFYHGILDEIEKRARVKEYIDDSIVQQYIHIGDRIGTQVKDAVVQRSTIGTGTRKCTDCSREVEANEKFCPGCGARL